MVDTHLEADVFFPDVVMLFLGVACWLLPLGSAVCLFLGLQRFKRKAPERFIPEEQGHLLIYF